MGVWRMGLAYRRGREVSTWGGMRGLLIILGGHKEQGWFDGLTTILRQAQDERGVFSATVRWPFDGLRTNGLGVDRGSTGSP